MDLGAFLLARIAEDEAVAREATHGPWAWEGSERERDLVLTAPSAYVAQAIYDGLDGLAIEQRDAEHIARYDPDRVLADCLAKRLVVEALSDYRDGYIWASGEASRAEDALFALALPYAGHPDYQQEWSPTARAG